MIMMIMMIMIVMVMMMMTVIDDDDGGGDDDDVKCTLELLSVRVSLSAPSKYILGSQDFP